MRERQILILMNGPAKSGKDTIAQAYADKYGAKLYHPALLSRLVCETIMGSELLDEEYNRQKDMPMLALRGKTMREVMIAFSEDFMKPLFGRDIFGRLLMDRAKRDYASPSGRPLTGVPAIITSIGFDSEVRAITEEMFATKQNTLICFLSRPGCGYSPNDSRHYLTEQDYPEHRKLWYENSGSVEEGVQALRNEIIEMQATNF